MELIIVGSQSGDEGKGKYTDVYSQQAWAVVRYQGGPHTGHTVVVGANEYRFVQVPSGMLDGAKGVLGNGCVIDPGSLIEELDDLMDRGVNPELAISETCHVIFPYHRAQDEIMEQWRGNRLATVVSTGFEQGVGQLGSTCRGVGPCREDKIARIGLRMVDLLDEKLLRMRLPRLLALKRSIIEKGFDRRVSDLDSFQAEDWDSSALVEQYLAYGERLAHRLCNVATLLADGRRDHRNILYEGAQSVALDVEHGTYPFCSSGYSAANGVCVGTGSPPGTSFEVFAATKAYMTQVGGGPLPTELDGDIAEYIVERGREYGTVTGRRRRVGWLDLCFLRNAVRVDGIGYLCLSSIDVLAGLDEVKVATHYAVGQQAVDYYPASLGLGACVQPVYETLPGWPELDRKDIARHGYDALPHNARNYVMYISEILGVGVAAVGVGPRREDTIVLHTPF